MRASQKILKEIDETNEYKDHDSHYHRLESAEYRARKLTCTDKHPIGTKILILWNGWGRVYATKYQGERAWLYYGNRVNLTFLNSNGKRKKCLEVSCSEIGSVIEEVQCLLK